MDTLARITRPLVAEVARERGGSACLLSRNRLEPVSSPAPSILPSLPHAPYQPLQPAATGPCLQFQPHQDAQAGAFPFCQPDRVVVRLRGAGGFVFHGGIILAGQTTVCQ